MDVSETTATGSNDCSATHQASNRDRRQLHRQQWRPRLLYKTHKNSRVICQAPCVAHTYTRNATRSQLEFAEGVVMSTSDNVSSSVVVAPTIAVVRSVFLFDSIDVVGTDEPCSARRERKKRVGTEIEQRAQLTVFFDVNSGVGMPGV